MLSSAALVLAERITGVEVKIATQKSSVGANQDISLTTVIRNVSKQDERFQVWSCSYPKQWMSDKPTLIRIPDVPCKKNDISLISLKPGETYRRELSIQIVRKPGDDTSPPLTFRLRFESIPGASEQPTIHVWSNFLKLWITA